MPTYLKAIIAVSISLGIHFGTVGVLWLMPTETLEPTDEVVIQIARIEKHEEETLIPKSEPPAPPIEQPKTIKEVPKADVPKVLPKELPKKLPKKLPEKVQTSSINSPIVPTVSDVQESKAEVRPPQVNESQKATQQKKVMTRYEDIVASLIAKKKRYPMIARRRGQQGDGMIEISISKDGELSSSKILLSTSNSSLDDEMMKMVERAAPFPEFPKNLTRNSLTLRLPISFQLH